MPEYFEQHILPILALILMAMGGVNIANMVQIAHLSGKITAIKENMSDRYMGRDAAADWRVQKGINRSVEKRLLSLEREKT